MCNHRPLIVPTRTLPKVVDDPQARDQVSPETPWIVIVWNDPINLMSYVTYVFMKVLKMKEADAERHMLEVHQKGKSIVARGNAESCELFIECLRSFGLKTTLQKE
jgi:ATP-dependent Clp protease adaptor protein ClpS